MAQEVFARIVRHQQVSPYYYRLQFESDIIAREAHAGQFVHLLPRSSHTSDPLLRRAFSILSTHEDTFEILYKVLGIGTKEMSGWQVGQVANVIGPLGKPFRFDVASSAKKRNLLLVGGGVGVPPLAMLASKCYPASTQMLIGARSKNDVMCKDDFAKYNVPTEIATEDGSEGILGLVTDLLAKRLNNLSDKSNACVYSCGPLPMLRAVALMCIQSNVACQVSLEENMPCGIGVCNGCVVPMIGASNDYGRYQRVCIEGPVMSAKDIDWSHWETKPCP